MPADAIVGVSGLSWAADDRLRGPRGRAARRPISDRWARGRSAGAGQRHTPRGRRRHDHDLPAAERRGERARRRYGVVALAPASGQILAVAGIGLDALQPPGSTFKMVTVSAVLQAGLASPRSTFAYQTAATLDGVALHNANGESCGGSLTLAFATSCNSGFGPLGVQLGAPRLVAPAERSGFQRRRGVRLLPGGDWANWRSDRLRRAGMGCRRWWRAR